VNICANELGIKTSTDEFMAKLPGVTEVIIPHKPGEALMIQEVTLDPGATIPLHYHLERREMYFWLFGKGVLIMGGQEYEFSEAGLKKAFIPGRVVHGLRNDSAEPLRLKVMYNALTGVYGDIYLD
jgi:quercetin dioxygenase-like cupin family protein